MARINLCMVVNNLDVGGLEKLVISLLRHLPRDVFDLSLVCLSGEGKLFAELDLPPGRTLVLDKNPVLAGLAARASVPSLVLQIRRFLCERRVQVVHAHNLAPLLFGGVAGHSLRPRPDVVYTEHNQIYRSNEAARKRFRQYVRLADEIIAVSHELSRTLAHGLRVPRPVRVIHNGIDGTRFDGTGRARVRRELGVQDDAFVVGTAVVLSEQKGITYLLEAAEIALAQDPKLLFLIAGDGPLRSELTRAAEAKNLGGRLRFLGYRKDVPDLLSAFDLYVLPSLWEGLPLALLEAMALGKPIVATTVGGNPEVVEHGENGYLVPPRDPVSLAEHLLRVARDAPFREVVRANNVRKFKVHFSLDAMVSAYAEVYEHSAGPRARRQFR